MSRELSDLPPYEGQANTLHGWLTKRHAKEHKVSGQWAQRYFSVDERRGTLSYAKSEHKVYHGKSTAVLPLCDITSVKIIDMDEHGPFCMLISCPPVHLTVRARDSQVRVP